MRSNLPALVLVLAAAVCGCGADQAPPPRPVTREARVFALLVCDTKARDAVGGFTLDVDQNHKIVRQLLAAGIGGERLSVVELRGEDARPKSIQEAIQKFPVTAADTVLCYVTGAGAGSPKEADGFAFQLHGGEKPESLPRATLRKWLTDRQPRLAVLLSDTSTGVPSSPAGMLTTGPTTKVDGLLPELAALAPATDPKTVLPGFDALLFQSTGVVDLASSADGPSWGPSGETGFFTRSLVRMTHDARTKATSWGELYMTVRLQVGASFAAWRKAELGRIEQLPQPPPRADQEELRGLLRQESQSSRAYYLAGTKLKVVPRETGGKGVQVAELMLDSPARKAGVNVGDVIVKVDDAKIQTSDELDAKMTAIFAAKKPQATFRVRAGEKERDVVVAFPN